MNLLSSSLGDIVALPDQEAAIALDRRFADWIRLDKIQERSFVERGIIIRVFDRRKLWRFLTDPETGLFFPNLTAWLSCSDYLGCRRTNFEAKRVTEMLHDVPADKLIDIPKGNLHVMTQLSTQVRNAPDVLEAARTMPREAFEAKVEKDHPDQHLPARKAMRFRFTRDEAAVVEEWIEFAMENDVAGTREEAVMMAAALAVKEYRQ